MRKPKGIVESICAVLRRANHVRRPVLQNPDNLVGAAVEATFRKLAGQEFDPSRAFVLYFGGHLRIKFWDLGMVEVPTDLISFPVQKYTVSRNVIKIGDMYYQLFYNTDRVVIHNHADHSLRLLMEEIDKPIKPLTAEPSVEANPIVKLSVEFDAALGRRMTQCAEWAGVTLEEWAVTAFEMYVASSPEPAKLQVPKTPPGGELYQHRQDRSEKAPAFIARLYGHLLNGDFLRSDLRKLDPKAEMALRNWERLHGRCALNFPTKKERNDKLVAEGRLLTDDPMETMRRISAASYRQQKYTNSD